MIKFKKLRDAKQDLVFEITQADIDRGVRCNGEHCVVSEAVARVPFVSMVRTSTWAANVVFENGDVLRYIVSPELAIALKHWDKDGAFEAFCPPGKYRFLAPRGADTMLAQRKRGRERVASKDPNKFTQYEPTGRHLKHALRNEVARAQAAQITAALKPAAKKSSSKEAVALQLILKAGRTGLSSVQLRSKLHCNGGKYREIREQLLANGKITRDISTDRFVAV